jgi:hypothetical protein
LQLRDWLFAVMRIALYDYQEFNFADPYGDNGWLEDYTAGVRGEPISNVTLVPRNTAGQAQHIAGNCRPRSTTAAPVPAGRQAVCALPEARTRSGRPVRTATLRLTRCSAGSYSIGGYDPG